MGLPASAATLTINLDREFSGAAAPSGPVGSWARAVFADIAPNTVRLTMTPMLNSPGEFLAKDNKGWYFNLDPDHHANDLNFAHVSGEVSNNIRTGRDNFKADGDGYFDFVFGFDGGLAFGQAPVVYDITIDGGGLSAASFDWISVNGTNPLKNGFHSATHVQGISNPAYGSGGSGWIGNISPGDLQVVPLPTAGGMGLAGLLVLGMRRRGSRVR